MNTYGLIGFPLEHSFSKKYFTEKFQKENIADAEYKNFPLSSIEEFPLLLKGEPDLCGLNVTIPYKESVLEFVHEFSDEVLEIGAVNCIKIENEKLTGFNTDCYGFEESLKPLLKKHHKQALVLGSGGSSKAVRYVLKKREIDFKLVSSSGKDNSISYNDLNEEIMKTHLLIINTTPLGMFPKTDEAPAIPFQFLTSKHLLYDLIYNPEETLFLQKGKERGAKVKNGQEMLILQAEKSWDVWIAD